MTGRGHPIRGGRLAELDNRRGRGRPRKFPLSTPLQLPAETEVTPVVEELFRGAEGDEYVIADESDRLDMEKIKQIQQQKMTIVNPMAQKRNRGRPRGNQPSSSTMDEDLMEEEELQPEESDGTSDSQKAPITVLSGRSSRPRQAPKRLHDFVQPDKKQQAPVGKMLKMNPAPNLVPDLPSTSNQEEEPVETLIPIDDHVEEIIVETEPAPVEKKTEKTIDPMRPPEPKRMMFEKLTEQPLTPRGPPPAPAHLANKQNSRGRPANVVPPHRRPIPKDLVPPGIKRLNKDPIPIKRKEMTAFQERSMDLMAKRGESVKREPSGSCEQQQQQSQTPLIEEPSVPAPMSSAVHGNAEVKLEPPEAIHEVIVETDGPPPMPHNLQQQHLQQQQQQGAPGPSTLTDTGKKKEREAGKDLPSEHFPKEKARHVSTRGLMPYEASKSPMIAYDLRDQVMMHPDDIVAQEEPGAQQRVLTIQGNSFIEDRIGRADMMEDEEMKMMKSMQQNQQYIEVDEDGINVMYEMDPNDVIEGEEGPVGQEEQQYVMETHQMQKQVDMVEDDDDDLPPQLVAEGVPEEEDVGELRRVPKELPIDEEGNFDFSMMEDGETIRLNSPGGRGHDVRLVRDTMGNPVFIDEGGNLVELVTDTGAQVEPNDIPEQQDMIVHDDKKKVLLQHLINPAGGLMPSDRPNLEFSFLDNNNICCGLCGEIVLYEKLVTEHLPHMHPEFLAPGVELEEVPYEIWLKTRLKQEMKTMANGFRHYDDHEAAGFGGSVRLFSKGIRQLRKVSQIRVNVNEMTMTQLENALKNKMHEKMGRKVPVSLVDRLHARCDICQAVVSLNKKFEVVHLVRHFNAWHPAEHRCSQEWKDAATISSNTSRRPLSLHDFAVVSTDTDQNNLQCIWCGMFMDRAALGMHFTEVHAQQVIVPNCSLCLQEMVMTARLTEKYTDDFGISLPDEFHLHSSKLDAKFSSEKALDKAIDKHLKRVKQSGNENEDEENNEDAEAICTTNSQQSFGRRNRLKRKFVKPCFRQICPSNSMFFEAKSACEWKCRICHRNVYGAVISAGAIKHYKEFHPAEIDNMQYELVKARLERIGDGSMEFVHPQLVECLICNLTYALHKPFNICRAIRHLRLKHPEVMPETAGKPISGAEISETTSVQKAAVKREIHFGELITDPIALERYRKENFDQNFDKVQVVYGIKKNNEPAYILLMENEQMDMKTAQEMAEKCLAQDMEREDEEEQTSRDRQYLEEDHQQHMVLDEQDYEGEQQFRQDNEFQEQMVVADGMEMEGPGEETEEYAPYDANNPDHVLIEENEIMNDGNYEMIQDGEYQEMEDNRDVRFMTDDEIQEAQARGEYIEFAEEYVEEYGEQQ